jgi:hypothetical protein
MHYMTFVEQREENSKLEPTKISFWANSDGKIFFEMQPDRDADPYEYKMISELQRILDEYEIS